MIKVKLYGNDSSKSTPLAYRSFTFPGGEQHIRFCGFDKEVKHIKVFARLTQAQDIMMLLMAIDALRNQFSPRIPIDLVIPYLPYARQDRVCFSGEAFGLKVMANMINQLKCRNITLFDAHSPVALEALNNATSICQAELVKRDPQLLALLRSSDVLPVAPDKGAQRKIVAFCHKLALNHMILGNKIRCNDTGHIQHVEFEGCVQGKHMLIVDDICDGGRTFIEVAKSLKNSGAKSVSLYVTHGIFSNGLAVFKGLIDTIYTTDSFCDGKRIEPVEGVNLKVIKITEHYY